ncbi:MAG: MFS transporter [Candidatus Dormibacteraeota bacterium]|nr:MFS transporter [Candidatus Dormibacteraeota bacterium]
MRRAWRVLSVVCLASLMSGLNTSSLNIALPTIVRGLHATGFQASWILLSYMLTNTVLMVFFGRLADVLGRRQMYLIGVALFAVASLAAGFSPSAWFLIGCRVLQAMSGAMLITNSASLVTTAFPRSMLGIGIGIYMSSFSLAQLLGPTLGGLITDRLGWSWNFWFNVPIAVVCWAWSYLTLERIPRSGEPARVDLTGNLLVLLGLGSLLLALSEVGRLGWTSPWILGGFLVFVAAVPTFVWAEGRSAHPVVDFAAFSEPVVGFGVIAGFLGTMSRFAVVLLIGLYFQAAQGDSPSAAGLKIIPLSIAAIIASPAAGLMLRRCRPHTVAAASTAVSLLGLVILFAILSPTTPYWQLVIATVVIGLGAGSFIPANSTGMLETVPYDRVGITNAVRIMSQSSGVVITTALSLTIISAPLAGAVREDVFQGTLSQVSHSAVESLVVGYRWAIGLMMLASILCAVTTLAGRQARSDRPGLKRRSVDTAEEGMSEYG